MPRHRRRTKHKRGTTSAAAGPTKAQLSSRLRKYPPAFVSLAWMADLRRIGLTQVQVDGSSLESRKRNTAMFKAICDFWERLPVGERRSITRLRLVRACVVGWLCCRIFV